MLKESINKPQEMAGYEEPFRQSGESSRRRKYVTGIFEASVATSLTLISSFQLFDDRNLKKRQATDMFGIITYNRQHLEVGTDGSCGTNAD
jgi:hypothetical protein